MPVTIQYGPWSPDQADTPIQIPDTNGPLPVPCADCLNVIYTNGNYRSINSPSNATINGNAIKVMTVSPVSAFSYFDQVAQQETVFAGTSTGVQQLNPDGSWSNVTLITTQITALIGAALRFVAGNFLNSNSARGAGLLFTIGAITPSITGQAFVAGTVTLHSPFGATKYVGYNQTAIGPNFGSLAVTDSFTFGTFEALEDVSGSSNFIVGALSDPGKGAFATMLVNGVTQTSASCGYAYSASQQTATWAFPAAFGLSPGTTYTVVLT